MSYRTSRSGGPHDSIGIADEGIKKALRIAYSSFSWKFKDTDYPGIVVPSWIFSGDGGANSGPLYCLKAFPRSKAKLLVGGAGGLWLIEKVKKTHINKHNFGKEKREKTITDDLLTCSNVLASYTVAS